MYGVVEGGQPDRLAQLTYKIIPSWLLCQGRSHLFVAYNIWMVAAWALGILLCVESEKMPTLARADGGHTAPHGKLHASGGSLSCVEQPGTSRISPRGPGCRAVALPRGHF